MKKLLPIIFIVFLTFPLKSIYSQGWQLISPETTPGLFALSFGSDNVGYIIPWTDGSEQIIKTTNGGLNWFNIPGADLNGIYKDIFFLDENIGYCLSSYNQHISETNVSMTTNGGNSWIPKTFIPSLPFNQETERIFFVNVSTGFVISRTQSPFGGGKVHKTTNTGSNWNEQVLAPLHNPITIKFKDQNTGIIACDSGYIYRTTNGGNNWQSQHLGLNTLLYDIDFVNQDTIYIVSQNSRIYKSFNSGINWTLQNYTPSNLTLRTVDFVDNNTGIIMGRTGQQNYTIITTNAGNSWKTVDTIVTSMVLYKIDVRDSKKAVLIGLGGEILYSNTLGVPLPGIPILQSPSNNSVLSSLTPTFSWQAVSTAAAYDIQVSLDSLFSNLIWNTSSDNNSKQIPICNLYNYKKYFWRVRSTNLVGISSSWSQIRSFQTRPPAGWYTQVTNSPGINFNCVSFSDTLNGWSVGNLGKIIYTTSGGDCWENQISNTSANLYSVDFINENLGIAVGDSGKIIRTSNGGQNWNVINGSSTQKLSSISFINSSIAYIVGNNGVSMKTTNGGLNWSVQQTGTSENLNCVSFMDALTGWIVGNAGTILKSSNGGVNWNAQTSSVNENLNSIFIRNLDSGWCVGNNGRILKTVNGGNNWVAEASVSGVNLVSVSANENSLIWAVGDNGTMVSTSNSGIGWLIRLRAIPKNLRSIYFPQNANKCWIAGDSGTVLHSAKIDALTNIVPATIIPSDYKIYQNYPNPFNPSTILSFELPKPTQVKLSIYNIMGKEISILVNGSLPPGKYEYEWDAQNFSSGIYFYKLEAGDYIETRKMVLLK